MEVVWLWKGLLQVKFRSELHQQSSGASDLIHHQFMGCYTLNSKDSDQIGEHLHDTGVLRAFGSHTHLLQIHGTRLDGGPLVHLGF